MIANLQAHYGFGRMPFGRDLAPGMLHRHHAHNEAVARINWCVAERCIGVLTGEVGAGKTVAVRTVIAGLDTSRHTTIYLPNPMIGVRGIHEAIVTATGGSPSNLSSRLIAQARAALAAERDERGRTPVLVLDLCRTRNYADTVFRRGRIALRGWASGPSRPGRCRHSYSSSRKVRMRSGAR